MLRSPQSRSCSLLEACTNVALGFLLALVTQWVVYPQFGIRTTFATDSAIALIFTAVSLVRSYLVRRAFEMFACSGMAPPQPKASHARP
jgi:hypothetical protein